MRKFVSAITSLAIAATALSGTMMFSASAADKTIFEFRSGDSNTVEVSAEDIKAGTVSVPVVLYVPASTGFNTASLKMAINGDATVGQYEGQTINGVEHTQYHFGNYGIQMEVYNTGEDYEGYSYPCCLDGGEVTGELGAGYAMYCPTVTFVPSSFNMSYQHSEAVMADKNVDSYGAYATNGTSGVTTWDETDSWAYEYGLIEFNLILPKDLAEGEYVLDIFKDEYVNIASLNLPTPVKGKSRVTGINGEVEWESRALTIKVGDAATTTTTTSQTTPSDSTTTTTSTSTSTSTPPVGDGQVIKIDSATVAPGESVTLNVTVTGDTGTAGASLYFLYDEALTLDSLKTGNAYRVAPQLNPNVPSTDGKNNVAAFVWATDKTLTAKDGATLFTMNFTAPSEPGEYKIDLLKDLDLIFDGVNKKFNEVNNLDGEAMPFTVVGGTITVEGESDTTTTTTTSSSSDTTTTTTSAPITDGQVIKIDSATVAPGESVTLNVTVTGDTGTAGASLYFLYDEALTLDSLKTGNAYRVAPQLNPNVPSTDGKNNVAAFVWATDKTLTAKDGAILFTMNFTAPTEPGEYKIDLLKDLDLIFDGVNKKFNEVNNLDGEAMPFTVVGGTITVEGEADTTTSETTTTTTPTDTTTTESTTTTTSTTPAIGEIYWGDVDCDQDVDIADVVRLNKFNAGNADVSEQGQLNADCAYDGKLDAEDALAIKKYLAHILKYEELGNQ